MGWNYVYDFSDIPIPSGKEDEARIAYVALPQGSSMSVGEFQIEKIWNSSSPSCECCDRWVVAAWRRLSDEGRSPARG